MAAPGNLPIGRKLLKTAQIAHRKGLLDFPTTLGGSRVMLGRNFELLRSTEMSRIGTIALLAILGTVLVFLFPAAYGPFTATNGPATAFRAASAIQALLMLLFSSVLIALVQRPTFSVTLDPVSYDCGGHHLAPFNLRC
jgi:hypothetical protein